MNEYLKTHSWKTTTTGVMAIFGAGAALAFDIKHGTVTYEKVMAYGAAIMTGIGLLNARDNNKSSEQVGAGVIQPEDVPPQNK